MEGLIGYASNTGSSRNLEALRLAGWRILLTPDKPTPRAGLRFAIDNGAWPAYQNKTAFPSKLFGALVERNGGQADFVVIPDVVAGGAASMRFSRYWMPRLKGLRLPLLAIQDGMTAAEVSEFLGEYPQAGLFLGGSTEWKLRTMYSWGAVAAALGRYYHVGRVNSAKRIRLVHEAGAHSFDGTAATRYSVNVPRLQAARAQERLFTARIC